MGDGESETDAGKFPCQKPGGNSPPEKGMTEMDTKRKRIAMTFSLLFTLCLAGTARSDLKAAGIRLHAYETIESLFEVSRAMGRIGDDELSRLRAFVGHRQ